MKGKVNKLTARVHLVLLKVVNHSKNKLALIIPNSLLLLRYPINFKLPNSINKERGRIQIIRKNL